MSVNKIKVSEINGEEIYLIQLDNQMGLKAEILNYGGIIKRVVYKNIDVVLGREQFEDYLDNDGCFGALIGRNSNRLEDACFNLSGKFYKLSQNDGKNNLHSGNNGFDKRVFKVKEVNPIVEPSVTMELYSPDGDEGFPGNLNVYVTYTLTRCNSLKIHYEGVSDADTLLNMTNHSYFNLNGHNSGTIENHSMFINAEFYTPNSEEGMPYGEIQSVKGTSLDFTEKKYIKSALLSDSEQIRMSGGIDHNFAISDSDYRLAVILEGEKTGIQMEVYTDRPGIQIYTGNWINEEKIYKDNARYNKHYGICFETQAFPNSLKYPFYPNAILRKNEKYDTTTEYKFE